MRHRIDAREISLALGSGVESLCSTLLPRGQKRGHEWRVGSLDGEAGQSLGVHLRGARAGIWADFCTGESGDALDLVAGVLRLDIRDALAWSRDWLGLPSDQIHEIARSAPLKTSDPDPETLRRVAYARSLWRASVPIAGTLGETYLLRTRCIELDAWPATIRFHPRLQYTRADGSAAFFPGLIVPVQKAGGEFCGVWRTYLDPTTADKAQVENPRRGLGEIQGGSVRLTPIANEMTVAEGLESALSVLVADPARAVLVGLSSSIMQRLQVPDRVRRVVLIEENDRPDKRGRRASPDAIQALAERLLEQGRSVVVVRTPDGFKDLNDLLRGNAMGVPHAA